MNFKTEFIQIEKAIWQLESRLVDDSLLVNILKNQGFFDLIPYIEKGNVLIKADKFTKLEIQNLIIDAYSEKPVIRFGVAQNTFLSAISNHTMRRQLKFPTYYWRADDFYKKLGNNEPRRETVVYYNNKTTSNEQKELQSEIAKLKGDLLEQKHQFQNKSKELAALQTQLDEANVRIKEIESQTNDSKYLSVFDKNNDFFAPDLAHAINLWLDTYGNGKKKDDSHTNLANQWIKLNTNYDKNSDGYKQVESRIREITTPLKDFGAKRLKEK